MSKMYVLLLTEENIRLLRGLVVREAARLDASQYQRPSEYPQRLKKLKRLGKKVVEALYPEES